MRSLAFRNFNLRLIKQKTQKIHKKNEKLHDFEPKNS